jgi:hypothetical protein
MFAIKAEICDPGAKAFVFSEQKTMYGGKHVARGDMIFLFASENADGPGLIASGIVTSVESTPKKRGLARQTPREQHHRQAHRARPAPPRTERPQALFSLERRSTRDRAQLQVLSSSDEQDCRYLRSSGCIPPRILLALSRAGCG